MPFKNKSGMDRLIVNSYVPGSKRNFKHDPAVLLPALLF